MDIPDSNTTLLLVLVGVLMGVVGELVSFLFVYQKNEFKKTHKEILKLWREYYAVEAECGGIHEGRAGRAAAAIQTKIIKRTKSLSPLKQKGSVCVGLLFILSMPLVHSLFEGGPGAFLPFPLIFPFTLFQYTKPAVSLGAPPIEGAPPGGPPAGAPLGDKEPPQGAPQQGAPLGGPPSGVPVGAPDDTSLPPMCTTSAIFMISMVLSKLQIQKILGVNAPGGLQQQAAVAATPG